MIPMPVVMIFIFCSHGNTVRESENLLEKEELADSLPNVRTTVQFDGKRLNEHGEVVDREPCVLTGFPDGKERLLGIPKLPDSKGQTVGDSAYHLLVDHNAEDTVVAVVMDTTAANSGHKIGAGVILERKLNRALLKPYCE
jgi:hypothetical protein